MIRYQLPSKWISYDRSEIATEFTEAKAVVMSLQTLPFQRRWVEDLQEIQLKLEVAGTSKIEGADFTGNELDVAVAANNSAEELFTRSQRQARAAVEAYRWIARLPEDQPIDEELVRSIHRQIVTGADDDHCAPGVLRGKDQNVTFGLPPHRGCDGGAECGNAFSKLIYAVQHEYAGHDPLIQALAFHYHFGAMHPFIDGNGRTARAMEALMLRRAGLKDTLFIAMSNFYYDEKKQYLASLAEVRARHHDLTPFLKFGLRGIFLQSQRLLNLLSAHIKKELFRNLAHDLFARLQTPRKRVIAERQLVLLEKILAHTETEVNALVRATASEYSKTTNPRRAVYRDLNSLISLGAVGWKREGGADPTSKILLFANLDWPSKITETAFFAAIKQMPKAKKHSFLVGE